jgi:hypothetical protein
MIKSSALEINYYTSLMYLLLARKNVAASFTLFILLTLSTQPHGCCFSLTQLLLKYFSACHEEGEQNFPVIAWHRKTFLLESCFQLTSRRKEKVITVEEIVAPGAAPGPCHPQQ